MANVKFELNLPGLNELMKSSEMQSLVDKAGSSVAAAAGEGFEKRTHVGSYAAVCSVFPTTAEAARKNMEDNALVKALGAGGLSM